MAGQELETRAASPNRRSRGDHRNIGLEYILTHEERPPSRFALSLAMPRVTNHPHRSCIARMYMNAVECAGHPETDGPMTQTRWPAAQRGAAYERRVVVPA